MNYMLIWEIIINAAETFLFMLFTAFMQPEVQKRDTDTCAVLKKATALFLLTAVLSVANHYSVSTIYTIILSAGTKFLYCLYFYRSSFLHNIFCVILFIVYTILADILSLFLPVYIFHVDMMQALAGGTLRIPCTLFYLMLLAFLLFFTVSFINTNIYLNITEKLSFFFISLLYIFFTEYLLTITLRFFVKNGWAATTLHLTISCLLAIITYFFLLIFLYRLGLTRHKNIELIKYQHLYENEKMEYQNLVRTTDTLRKIKHDIYAHLKIIDNYIQMENYTDLSAYLSGYIEDFQKTPIFIASGNTAVDVTVSSCIQEASDHNITFTHQIHLPDPIPLQDHLLSSMLNNILKNALEECGRITDPDTKKKIHLAIKPYRQMLIISCVNTSTGNFYYNTKGELISQKNSPEHGYGLKRISEIAESAGGYMKTYVDADQFTIQILLPIRE